MRPEDDGMATFTAVGIERTFYADRKSRHREHLLIYIGLVDIPFRVIRVRIGAKLGFRLSLQALGALCSEFW